QDIRRFFAPNKPATQKPAQNSRVNKDDDVKKKPKLDSKASYYAKSPKTEEKSSVKRKKRAIIDSDSEEEKPNEKPKKPSKGSQKSNKTTPPSKKEPIQYVSETDSDSDTFVPLKKPKSKENGLGKTSIVGLAKGLQGRKEKQASGITSPKKTSTSAGKSVVTSPSSVTKAKVSPPQFKMTPTSVLDYFGNGSIQRSEKKLVASTKRKADPEDSQNDEAIARQLQMDEDMDLEKQLHDDEEFARTLAMLDEEPLPKKARKDSGSSPTKSSAGQAQSSKSYPASSSQSRTNRKAANKSPSPKKRASPIKTSSKLAMMKRKDEEESAKKMETTKMVTLPKEEPEAPLVSERLNTPKSGKALISKSETVTKPVSSKISPKKLEDTSPEDSEKKRGNSLAYRNYLNREGPRALGSKEIPQGAENCLEGLTFVLTGVLESMEREDAKSLIERHGGKVTGNISRKTSYLVLGRDGGASKTEKAESLGTKIIDEDGLLDLIRTKPGKKSKYEIAAEAESIPERSRTRSTPQKTTPIKETPTKKTPTKKTPTQKTPSSGKRGKGGAQSSSTPPGRPYSSKRAGGSMEVKKGLSFEKGLEGDRGTLLWVDKYRPQSLKGLIGQQGEQSCANKLLRWLQNWHHWHAGDKKPPVAKFSKFGGKDDGSGFKAALLSGPPGVGKTTTAVLVCEELGYSYVEMNASCTRSKNSLKEVIAESLNNTSIKNFYTGTSQTVSSKHVLIMDEVDGMAGNEDRGGIQEMIGLIKQTKIPIICMCNDRNHPKIRSLANYCFDLRFQRARVEQIKGAMMSIAFKEGLKIPPPALNEIILASNQDIRQVLHNLSMWSAKDKVMTYDQAKADANKARKDLKLGPFDVCRKVFAAGEETAHMSLIDKSDLFFHDYSLAPLFVQENYLHVRPAAASGNLKSHLVLLSKTADSICDGDLVDRQIRSHQTWSLLPTQAIYASVLPGELMRGYMSQFPTFPSWLGKFSSSGKHNRIIQELATHMSLRIHSSKQAVNLDYLPYLCSSLLEPLQRSGAEGAAQAVQLMDDYNLVKEDVDSIMEISTWGGQPDPYSKLDPKVKAAFTRAYNRESHLTPYSLQIVKKGRQGAMNTELGAGELDQESQELADEEEDEQGSLATDAMIKQKKVKSSKQQKQEQAGDSRKGKGKGKGKGKK
ncbi:replication factor C subunit 1 isoform X2, partial [Arapaima gigas]